jgi:aspartate racemase
MDMSSTGDLARLDITGLHDLVYRQLLPRLSERDGREAAERHLLRFKVLGGLGPAATADFLQDLLEITPARRDREHLRLDIAIDPLMGRMPDASPLPGTQATLDHLLGSDRPTVFCLVCNTAHDRIEALTFDRKRVGFVSMVEATVKAATAGLAKGAKVGLLATQRMVESNLYQQAFARAGFAVVAPEPDDQRLVNTVIYGGEIAGQSLAGVKGGDISPAQTGRVQRVASALVREAGVQALCVSCTELPLVFGPQRGGDRRGDGHGAAIVNSTRALAEAFLHACLMLQARVLHEALSSPDLQMVRTT